MSAIPEAAIEAALAERMRLAAHPASFTPRQHALSLLEAAAPHLIRAAKAEALREVDARMFGTDEGGFLSDNDQVPVGELRRLLWVGNDRADMAERNE